MLTVTGFVRSVRPGFNTRTSTQGSVPACAGRNPSRSRKVTLCRSLTFDSVHTLTEATVLGEYLCKSVGDIIGLLYASFEARQSGSDSSLASTVYCLPSILSRRSHKAVQYNLLTFLMVTSGNKKEKKNTPRDNTLRNKRSFTIMKE